MVNLPPMSSVATDVNDFKSLSPENQAGTTRSCDSNLVCYYINKFSKAIFLSSTLTYSVAGFGFDTVVAWGAGRDFAGIWLFVPALHPAHTPGSIKYV